MVWSVDDLLGGLYVAIAIMLIIVLYHAIFIVVDLRKTMRRVQVISESLESAVLKPLTIADQAFDWVIGSLAGKADSHAHHTHHKHHKKED